MSIEGEKKPISPLLAAVARPRAVSSAGAKSPIRRGAPPRLINAALNQTRSGENVSQRPPHPFQLKDHSSSSFVKSSDDLGNWAKLKGKEEENQLDSKENEEKNGEIPFVKFYKHRKSRSEDILNTWERPDAEELQLKFEALLSNEKKADLSSKRKSILLESAGLPRRADSIDEGDSNSADSVSDFSAEDGLPVAKKFTETKLEEDDRLLVGIEDSREVILAGTVDELFSSLTSKRFGRITVGQSSLVAPPFVEEFLYTYRYFTSAGDGSNISPAQEVMKRITAIYQENSSSNPTPEQQALEGANQLRIIGVLKTWMDHHFYDFEGDSELYKQLMNLIKIILTNMNETSLHTGVKTWGNHLVKLLEEKLSAALSKNKDRELAVIALKELGGIHEGITIPLLLALLPRSGLTKPKVTFSGSALLDWIEKETGQDRSQAEKYAAALMLKGIEDQKRMLEKFVESHASYCLLGKSDKELLRDSSEGKVKLNRIFSFLDLKPSEIAKQFCLIDHEMLRKITPRELSHQAWSKDPANSPNVLRIIDRSNEVSYWVATEIVACPNLRRRITIVKRFIQIAEYCHKMNNFCSSLSIVAGLNLGCVQRMKKTWEEIPKTYIATFDILTDFISSIGNFRRYRRAFKIAQKPAIPYIAVILKDLTFIEDGNPNFRADGMVNFEKMTMLANSFAQIQNYQEEEYPFVELPDIRNALTDLAVIKDEKELYRTAQLSESGQGQTKEPLSLSTSQSKILPFGTKKSKDTLIRKSILPMSFKSPKEGKEEKSPKIHEITAKLEYNKDSRSKEEEKKDEKKVPKKSESVNSASSPKPTVSPKLASSSSESSANSPVALLKGMKKTLKIVVIGDGAVGKTSLLIAYTSGGFLKSEYIPTIFDNYNMIENNDGAEISLILWDTAGQEEFAAIRTANYVGTDCFILCYSCNNFSSLRNITEKWVPEIKQHCPNAMRILIGTKSDTEADSGFVSVAEAERLLKTSGASFHMRCSALKGENVKEVFVECMKKTLAHKPKKTTKKVGPITKKK